MSRIVTTLALTASICALTGSVAAADAAASTCGAVPTRLGPVGIEIEGGRVTCSTARRVVKRYIRSKKPCGGSGCYRTIAGWTCGGGGQSTTRVLGCSKGRRLIGVYRIYD